MTYVALVTGASSGIGEATARRLAAQPDTHVILVARREDRLRELQAELGAAGTSVIAVDLTEEDAPTRIAEQVAAQHGALHLLVNNAGARWSATFAQGGWANVERHMRVNFDAHVRLIEALLPLLHRTAADTGRLADTSVFAGEPLKAPVAIVNVSSTAGRVVRRGSGAYSASKFALAGWSDALYLEERATGVHVGLVLPGFIQTEGFPQAELRARPLTRWLVSDVDTVVDAILATGPGGHPERYAPRWYWVVAALRVLAPSLTRRVFDRGSLSTETHST